MVSVCGGDTNRSNAWVFVNKTIVDAYISSGSVNQGSTFVGSNNPFSIVSTADPVTDFTVHNPPSSDFIVSSTTQIEVCFSADHTYISDLGFYFRTTDLNGFQVIPFCWYLSSFILKALWIE